MSPYELLGHVDINLSKCIHLCILHLFMYKYLRVGKHVWSYVCMHVQMLYIIYIMYFMHIVL